MNSDREPEDNAEWTLLNAIVNAGNSQNMSSLLLVLNDPQHDFSDKPRCIMAAISAIHITPQTAQAHEKDLLTFLDKIKEAHLSLRCAFRRELLQALLDEVHAE